MLAVFIFVGITAIVSALCYLAIRPLLLEHWDRWQKERRDTEARTQRERRETALRAQATARVLAQITQQEERYREKDRPRKAA